MYAVIKTGGKQYRVQPGDIVRVEKLSEEVGKPVEFNEVLFVSNQDPKEPKVWIGKPHIENALIQGEILAQGRGEKIIVQKFKRRKQYRRKQGHRQNYTEVLITGLNNGAGDKTELSKDDKKKTMDRFFTLLTPKGGHPPKEKKEKDKATQKKA